MRPAAIAEVLGTTPATVRRWVRRRFEGMTRDAHDDHVTALLQAIESQREIVRAAWEAYAHEREVEAAILRGELDYVRRRAVRRPTAGGISRGGKHHETPGNEVDEPVQSDQPGEELLLEEYDRPKRASQGAKYLAVALSAQREIARLQGLYQEIAQEPAEIKITLIRRPDGPENIPPGQRRIVPALPVPGDEEDDAQDEESSESESGVS